MSLINFKKYLYIHMCFIVGKETRNVEEIIGKYTMYINQNKEEFSFSLYTLKEGSNLSFNIEKNQFNKNKEDILTESISFLHKDLSNEEKKRKGLLVFSLGDKFKYSNNYVSLEKINNKLIGKKNNIPFFKKTYNLKDFIGVLILGEKNLNLNKLAYKIQQHGDVTFVTFYSKEYNGTINNFTVFAIFNGEIHNALLCIDGEYILFRIENNIEKHNKFFPTFKKNLKS